MSTERQKKGNSLRDCHRCGKSQGVLIAVTADVGIVTVEAGCRACGHRWQYSHDPRAMSPFRPADDPDHEGVGAGGVERAMPRNNAIIPAWFDRCRHVERHNTQMTITTTGIVFSCDDCERQDSWTSANTRLCEIAPAYAVKAGDVVLVRVDGPMEYYLIMRAVVGTFGLPEALVGEVIGSDSDRNTARRKAEELSDGSGLWFFDDPPDA